MDRLHRLHQLQPPLRIGARKPMLACFPAARAEQTHRSASTHWWSCVIANSPTCVFTVCHRFLAESAFFFFSFFASADELSGVADDGGRTRSNTTQGGSLRSCSPRSLRTESHLAAPRRRQTRGCRRRLSSSAAAAAAAPDHIKLSYSSDNNFRLLHSGPPYSQQWLWEAPGKAVEEELSGDEDEKQ